MYSGSKVPCSLHVQVCVCDWHDFDFLVSIDSAIRSLTCLLYWFWWSDSPSIKAVIVKVFSLNRPMNWFSRRKVSTIYFSLTVVYFQFYIFLAASCRPLSPGPAQTIQGISTRVERWKRGFNFLCYTDTQKAYRIAWLSFNKNHRVMLRGSSVLPAWLPTLFGKMSPRSIHFSWSPRSDLKFNETSIFTL